ncbi:uncharacterized protein LOC124150213 [Haliotis rufescens]|uniref:uncharacterized protein LOC124150213 n=1 Tax=Haliotis rufescens TaxID=6454 RepID=UPI00201F8B8E|nr:uncharacterized protein LOC124150213 [Haliotis rufescens]
MTEARDIRRHYVNYVGTFPPPRHTTMNTPRGGQHSLKSTVLYQRNNASRCLSHIAVPQIALGVLATLAGIVTVFIASVKLQFPFYIGADIWTGVTCITAGGVAHRIYSNTRGGKVTRNTQRLLLAYGCLTIACLCMSVGSLTLAGYVAYMCTDGNPSNDLCMPRMRANLALSVVDVVIECFIVVTSLVCFWKFSYYRYTFRTRPAQKMTKEKKSNELKQIMNSQDVYIARSPYGQGQMRAHPVYLTHGSRPGMPFHVDGGMPPPYTQLAPY